MLALLLWSAFLLLVACGGTTPTQVPPETLAPTDSPTTTNAAPTSTLAAQASGVCPQMPLPSYVTQVVLAKDTQGSDFQPVNVTEAYDPSQKLFHAVVTVVNAPNDLKLRAAWYLVKAEGYQDNIKIDESEYPVKAQTSGNLDFTLQTKEKSWPPGAYCVEFYADGNLAYSKNFTVTGATTPSNAGTTVIKQIVLAEDAAPTTFEPIRPTTTFKHNTPFIHAVIQIQDAAANTNFRARWYPPSQDPLDFPLQVGGSRWVDFRLTPAPDGFPTGDYKVEIYVNDQLADTKTFTVQ